MFAIAEEREPATNEPVINEPVTNNPHAATADIPLIFVPNLPTAKYHHKPLQFISKPGMKQEDYEKKVLAHRYAVISGFRLTFLFIALP